jgi:hypothetical protein
VVQKNSIDGGAGTWSNWDAASYGQVNPQTTGADGQYGWDVPNGTYRVVFSKTGYKTVYSEAYEIDGIPVGVTNVPPPELKLHVGMVTIAPQVIEQLPAEDATNIAVDSNITAKFSEAIDEDTLTDVFTLNRSGSDVPGTVTYDSVTRTLTFDPTEDFMRGTVYTARIESTVEDTEGNTLPAAVTWSFTTVAAPGGGGGGGSNTDQVTEAINDAQNINTIRIDVSTKSIATLTTGNVEALNETSKPTAVVLQDATITLVPNAIPVPANASYVELAADAVGSTGSQVLFNQAINSGRFVMAGEVIDLTITAVAADGTRTVIRDFSKPIQVTIPVPEGSRTEAANGVLKVYWYNESSKSWENMGGTYNPADGTMTFSTNHFSKFALLADRGLQAATPVFTDISDHWAKIQIQYMADNGFVNGMGGGLFAPDANVNRAQFATMLANVLGLAGDTPAPFDDVQPGQWYYSAVGRAYAAGLIKGMGNGIFAPNKLITREQMAVMICNALNYRNKLTAISDPESLLVGFSDSSLISDWARDSAAKVVNQGILRGRAEGAIVKFAPTALATRAEAAVMLRNLLDKL